jgi:hypothetical protein
MNSTSLLWGNGIFPLPLSLLRISVRAASFLQSERYFRLVKFHSSSHKTFDARRFLSTPCLIAVVLRNMENLTYVPPFRKENRSYKSCPKHVRPRSEQKNACGAVDIHFKWIRRYKWNNTYPRIAIIPCIIHTNNINPSSSNRLVTLNLGVCILLHVLDLVQRLPSNESLFQ